MGVKIDGIESLLQKLDDIAYTENLAQAVGKACALVEREAKKKAPKDSGALRRSIQSTVKNEGGDIVGTIFSPLYYSAFVEMGTGLFAEERGRQTPWTYKNDKTGEYVYTKGQHPQPFLRPALEENRGEIQRILKEGVIK